VRGPGPDGAARARSAFPPLGWLKGGTSLEDIARRRSRDHQPPPKTLALREVAAWCDMRLKAWGPALEAPRAAGCSRLPVLVLPGFLASDLSTKPFREALMRRGWQVHGWGLGMNRGACQNMLGQVVELVDQIAGDGKLILIGWSFGGLYAREVAKLRPHLIDRVITMGTPFSGDPRANNLWRTYEKVAGYPVDQTPFDVKLNEKPPVPTTALWSRGDGIVAPACARGTPKESDRRIQVNCSHIGYMTKPAVLERVIDLLED
jgi:pimeloyl-ACP methyl ester carboxylesterase